MQKLAIIKTGSTLSEVHQRFGDFEQWFIQSLGPSRFDFDVYAVHEDQHPPADIQGIDAVVVTGSPAMVSHRHAWSERTAAWLAEFHQSQKPMLGVCYGHQLIAHALGGKVGPNPNGRAMGTRSIEILDQDDQLLGRFSPQQSFQVTHVEVVLEPPSGAKVIACSPNDPYHGLHFGGLSWGVQFHPEFDIDIMACYIQLRASVLAGEGIAADRLMGTLQTAPAGALLMQHFANLVEDHRSGEQ
jgi:GMP synthase (glutamine-hydrolysing)